MVGVHAASRLHFGLLRLPRENRPEAMPDGVRRCFGGVGLMVEEPGVRVLVRPASRWAAEGPLAERALAFARRYVTSQGNSVREDAFHIVVESCPAEHSGLGTGTQLALSVARALAAAVGQVHLPTPDLARRLGRGQRSALGIHGFDRGGFLVEGGKGGQTELAPLLARLPFPETWRVLLVVPRGPHGLHGLDESRAFDQLARGEPDYTDVLCRLVLLGLLPALIENDLAAFASALYEFNRRVGEMFHPCQGGTYGYPQGQAVVDFLRGHKVDGVGQSSWGPALFAIVDQDRAAELARRLRDQFGFTDNEVLLTRAANSGARLIAD
jgi:beta-RFAP synthase